MATISSVSCARCNELNSLQVSNCVMCGALLPRQAITEPSPLQTDSTQGNKVGTGFRPPQIASPSDFQTQAPPISTQPPSESRFAEWHFLDLGLQVVGVIVFVVGAFLWCGNVFHFLPTFPFVGYLTCMIGYGLWKTGSNSA